MARLLLRDLVDPKQKYPVQELAHADTAQATWEEKSPFSLLVLK